MRRPASLCLPRLPSGRQQQTQIRRALRKAAKPMAKDSLREVHTLPLQTCGFAYGSLEQQVRCILGRGNLAHLRNEVTLDRWLMGTEPQMQSAVV